MRGLALRFRLFGFPITIDPGFLFLLGFIYIVYRKPVAWVLEVGGFVFVSVLVHEMGHAIAGRFFGLKPSIRIVFMGGLTTWATDSDKQPSNLQHIFITLAGPFAGFILGGIILLVWTLSGSWPSFSMEAEEAFLILMFINFGWGILNLIPIYPLDGGQVVYYLMRINKKIPAERVSAIVSLAIGGAIILWAVLEQEYFTAVIVVWVISVNIQRLSLATQDTSRVSELAREIQGFLSDGKINEGLNATGELLSIGKVESIRGWATEMSALFLDLLGDNAKTLGFFREYSKYLSESSAVRFLKLVAQGETQEAVGYANRSLKSRPSQALVTVYLGHLIRENAAAEVPSILERFRQTRWYTTIGCQIQLRLIQANAFEESIRVGELVLEREGQPLVAYNLACAQARLGQARESLRWLEEAVRRGFKNPDLMATDDDLQLLQDYPAFQELIARLRPQEAPLLP